MDYCSLVWAQPINPFVDELMVKPNSKNSSVSFSTNEWLSKLGEGSIVFSLIFIINPPKWSVSRRLYICLPTDQTQIENGRAECVPIENVRLTKELNPNHSLDRYSATRNWIDNFLSSFIFLLASCLSFVLAVARYAFELTTNNLLNNQIKSVLDLMTDLGLTSKEKWYEPTQHQTTVHRGLSSTTRI